jgi:hypothetical protein
MPGREGSGWDKGVIVMELMRASWGVGSNTGRRTQGSGSGAERGTARNRLAGGLVAVGSSRVVSSAEGFDADVAQEMRAEFLELTVHPLPLHGASHGSEGREDKGLEDDGANGREVASQPPRAGDRES